MEGDKTVAGGAGRHAHSFWPLSAFVTSMMQLSGFLTILRITSKVRLGLLFPHILALDLLSRSGILTPSMSSVVNLGSRCD